MTDQAVPLPPTPVLSTPRLSPVHSDHRLHTLDILRGLALFGMILVHFHQKMRIEVTGLEDLIAWGVWILVEQKAWGIFAFLFGVGFAVLLRRLEARNAPVVAIYLRRLAVLAVFGVIAEVGFGFSILLAYAAWGVVLLFIRGWSTPALLATAVVAAAARPVAAELIALYTWWTHGTWSPSLANPLRQAAETAAQNAVDEIVGCGFRKLKIEAPHVRALDAESLEQLELFAQ